MCATCSGSNWRTNEEFALHYEGTKLATASLHANSTQVIAMKLQQKTLFIFSLIILLLGAVAVLGDPSAPSSLTWQSSSTWDPTDYGTQAVDAIAGNITALQLTGITQTRGWQGYYGNVTGTIVLDDADENTFYNWSDQEPRGQIYASLASAGTPTWNSVDCFSHATNATPFDTTYGFSASDGDNASNTYNRTDHSNFFINANEITGCPTTYIFQDDDYQQNRFANFLLWDAAGGADGWVFGTTIENRDSGVAPDVNCYNGGTCDFQLLVAEDGHGTDASPTSYFFWVDLQG